MDKEILLQPANETDLPVLVEFLQGLFVLEKDFTAEPEVQEKALKAILANPGHATIYKVMVAEETVGMIVLHYGISTAEGGWAGRIEDVYIKPDFRHRGMGKQVIAELHALAKSKGLTRLTLVADKDNSPAHEFYKACGFEEMNLMVLVRR